MEKSELVLELEIFDKEYNLDCLYRDDTKLKELQATVVDIVTNNLYKDIDEEDISRFEFVVEWIKVCRYARSMYAEVFREERFVRKAFQEMVQVDRKFLGFLKVHDYKVRVFMETDSFIIENKQ